MTEPKASNESPKATRVSCLDKVQSYLDAAVEEKVGIIIARETGLPEGTTYWALKILKERGKIIGRRAGKYTFWSSTRQYDNSILALMKKHGSEKWRIHGLTLNVKGEFTRQLERIKANTLGVMASVLPSGVVCWHGFFGGVRVTFQLGRESLTVQGRFSESPLDFDGFCLWLGWLDGLLGVFGLPCPSGSLGEWRVLQYGLGNDSLVVADDRPRPSDCVSLYVLRSFLARVYLKDVKGGQVQREEVHSSQALPIENFLGVISGGVTATQTLNLVYRVAIQLQANERRIHELTGALQTLGKRFMDYMERHP